MRPEVSVILPFYNAAATLSEAIQSIIEQNYTDWELLLIDDGSEDDSLAIAQGFESADSRIRIVQQVHSGIVAALNNGIYQSRGEFIARMDADDLSMNTRFSEQIEYLKQHPECGLVSCLVTFGGDKRKAAGYHHYVEWTNRIISHQDILLNRFAESPIAHPSVIFRKSTIDEVGPYQKGDFPEDYELWLRMLDHGIIFHKVSKCLLQWNDPSDRLSRNHPKYSIEAFYKIKSRYLVKWLSKHNPHFPNVVILGSGRTTRKRVQFLKEAGLEVSMFVDIDPKKIGNIINGVPIVSVDKVNPKDHFLVSMIGSRNASEAVRNEFKARKFIEGEHYIISA